MRVLYVRKGLNRFFGTVHSFISIPHLSGEAAEFHVVTTPSKLRDIDASNVNQVISLNQRLLGPIPYRGGDLDIELGLFSVKSGELAGPFLGVLEGMAKAAGVTYVNVALPFIGPLKEGINLLAGAQGDSMLEVGLSQTYQLPETGYYVVIRAQQGTLDLSKVKVTQDYQLEDPQGQLIRDYPYIVFCVEASPGRDDWFQIPEVSAAYKTLRDTVRTGDVNRSKEAFTVFKRIVLTSPDLLIADAQRLVNKVETEVSTVLKMMPTAAGPKRTLPQLSKIKLY
jgi:hypothetical protein